MQIKGVCIGQGRTKTIVSLMDGDAEALCSTAKQAVEAGADCLEWRADCFEGLNDAELVARTCQRLSASLPNTPLIFTVRSKGQGGQADMVLGQYVELVRTVIECGRPDLVDIEVGIGDDAVRQLVGLAHERGLRALVSYHDFAGTPSVEEMEALLVHMASLGADIPKLAVMARKPVDPRLLMQATAHARDQLDVPLLTMSMGIAGQHTRLSGEVFGSALTFCFLGKASAPGQVELAQALPMLEAVHRTLEQEP